MAAPLETGNANTGQKRGREEELGAGTGNDKKWPGWPGENVFRLLVPTQKVGGIIGRKGEFVKKMCEETKSRIKILDGAPGAPERIVMVSAKDEPDSPISPAMDGLLKVHRRLIEGFDGVGEAGRGQQGWTSTILTRMLLAGMQSGTLIGKQGSTIKSIQEGSGASARVLEDVPLYALPDDKVLEIHGEASKVHKALELVLSHLRRFLLDRSVLPLFESNMARSNQPQMEQNLPHQPWPHNPPNALPGGGSANLGNNSKYGPPIPQHDNYYPPADLPPPESHSHHGLTMYGREPPPLGSGHAMSNPPQPVIAQVTQRMQIPLSYADAVIGTNGANISYCRRNSGAVITIEETRGVPGEMTVEIVGSASQVQTAHQLIQNFIAGASGPPADPYNSMEPAYNSYPSHNSMYGSPPRPVGGHGHPTGPYESSYPGNYRY
eukprot:TRINITY_DN328_c0_g1_i1.p1 TRINITY_DN328_c0_g1~~TRINITY_DN328_c0_g1_i1.p1  ORF type:complete len:436 (+),score=99.40 TRINITY_DN328_c0_g1_i1:195-1502(+)